MIEITFVTATGQTKRWGDMSGIHILHSEGIARYRWGGLLLEVSGGATTNGRMVVEIMADAAAGVFRWTRPRDVRAAIDIVHELIHYQQDYSTGLGAWDHIASREALPALTAAAAHAHKRWRFQLGEPVLESWLENPFADEARFRAGALLTKLQTDTVVLRELEVSQWPTEPIVGCLARWEGLTEEELRLAHNSVRYLLEGEAACRVDQFIGDSQMSQDSKYELDRNKFRWSVASMASPYQDLFMDTIQVIFGGGQIDREDLLKGYNRYLDLAAWIADIAQSYPPPDLLAEFGEDRAMFDPAARHLVLLRALSRLSAKSVPRFVEAFFEGDWSQAEQMLLEVTQFQYPHSRDIYQAWMPILEAASSGDTWDSALFKLRADAIRFRLDNPVVKGIVSLPLTNLPLQMLVPGFGIQGFFSGTALLDDELRRSLVQAVWLRRIDMEIYDLHLFNKPFICPLATSHLCTTRKETCSAGYRDLFSLPAEGDCYVRRELKGIGYEI